MIGDRHDNEDLAALLYDLKRLIMIGFETLNHNIDRLEDRVDRLEARLDSSDTQPFYEH